MPTVHGVVSIPLEIAARIPDVAAAIRAREQQIIDLCQSPDFSLEKLSESRSERRMRNIMRTFVSRASRPPDRDRSRVLTSSCSRHEPCRRARKPPDAPTVAVAKASTEDLSHGLVLTAEFKPFQEVDVMAKVAGYVKQINVDVGDRVKQGQLLATLEIPEMADDLKRADAAVDPRPAPK